MASAAPARDIVDKWFGRGQQKQPGFQEGTFQSVTSPLTSPQPSPKGASSTFSSAVPILRIPSEGKGGRVLIPAVEEFERSAVNQEFRSQGPDGTDASIMIQQCAQTVAWLAQTVQEDRNEMQEWMRNMERLQKDQSPQLSDVHFHRIEALVSQEFKNHHMWVTDKFQKLGKLLTEAAGGPAGFASEQSGYSFKERLQPSVRAVRAAGEAPETDHLLPDNAPSAMEKEEVGGASVHFESPDLKDNAVLTPRSSHDLGDDDSSQLGDPDVIDSKIRVASGISGIKAHDPRRSIMTPQFGMEFEKSKMEKHLKRMNSTYKKRNPLKMTLQRAGGLSDKTLNNLRRKPEGLLIAIADSTMFQFLSMSIVMLNGIWIGYQTNYGVVAMRRGDADPEWFRSMGRIFAVAFSTEIILRLCAYRCYFFTCNDRGWNIYDLCVVCAAAIEEIFDTMNINFLRILRIFRMIRITRVIRVLRFFQRMRHLLCALMGSLSMVSWAVVFLVFIMYIFAVLLMQSVQFYADRDNERLMRKVFDYYGDLPTSMYTLLMAVTGGQPWDRLLDPLREVTDVLVPLFCIYVIFVLYGLLNVVNACFVEHARELKDRDRDLAIHKEMEDSESFGQQLRHFYQEQGLCDDDVVDWEAFASIMRRADVQMFLQTHSIDVCEAEQLFHLIDMNGDGSIKLNNFVFGCQRLKNIAKGMDLVLLYDQVLQTQTRITTMMDKQNQLHHDINHKTDAIVAEVARGTQCMSEMAGDLFSQSQLARQQRGTLGPFRQTPGNLRQPDSARSII